MSGLLVRLAALAGILRGLLGRGGRRAAQQPDDGVDPRRHETPSTPARELQLVGLLLLGAALLVAFAACVVVAPDTQLLGGLLGGALLVLAVALVHAGKLVVPQETAVEERPPLPSPPDQQVVDRDVAQLAQGVSRRRLIAAAGGAVGAGLGAAIGVPAVTAIGPGTQELLEAPWRRGTLLVDEEDAPVSADDLVEGAFLTAFPQGADKRELGSPVVVVRVDPARLELPPQRGGWAPEGLMAYSKVCTHAGCAVSLFRSPLYEPNAREGPALVCPCHYSTFDVLRAGDVTFGPAGRPLPQLPLAIDAERRLVASGPLAGSVGPAWWGTDRAGS